MTPKKRNWFGRFFGTHSSSHDASDNPSSAANGSPMPSAPGSNAPLAEPGPQDPPVPLPRLDLHQSTALIRQIVRTLNSLGYGATPTPEVVYYSKPEHIEKPLSYPGPTPGPYGGQLPAPDYGEGSMLGLENLTKQCANAEDFGRDMPVLVEHFVNSLVGPAAASERELLSLPDAEFYSHLRARLMSIDLLPEQSRADAREFNPDSPIRPYSDDLCITLVLDTPNSVVSLSPGSLDDRGPIEDLFRIGYRNLWQELIDSDLDVQPVRASEDRPEERFWAIESSSYYAGSVPLLMNEILERLLPQIDPSEGLIFSTPHRHITLVREMGEGTDMLGSIKMMAAVTAQEFSRQAGAMSPRLMFSHMAEITTFTDIKSKGGGRAEIDIQPPAYLMERINQGKR
ncbi:Uncharacterised protein [Corynebacterium jeikeium]|uniref:Uncharacterized protein n=1 Tax=Corynebacterium jeikeium (strain K411) TaxID=306537 RepID=Q4JXX3_CORJK|nr:hypothetical protein [Corynebacterium jeikeium]CAI36334.1 hypothetical protein jk0182 [Corynebacterium jeikeium K411]SUY84124.1 Uncharacterised protein [Corynebacterium jeikeium]